MGGSGSVGFGWLDWLVLILYFVGITAFGLWVARKIRSSGGYFLGDRKLPWWVMIGQSFGTGTHAENPVGQAGATYHFGFATIWYQWKNMLITPFYWLMAPWYRRCERTTIGELMGDRYGPGMALLYTVFALGYFVLNQGAMMKGAGKVISVATGGEIISPNGVVVAMVATTLLYSVFGGLVASAYTDFVQGFLIIVLSFLLIPAGLSAVGGFSGMRDCLSQERVEHYAAAVEQKHAEAVENKREEVAGLQRRRAAAPPADSAKLDRDLADAQQKLDDLKLHPPVIPGDKKGTSQFFDVYNKASKVTAFMLLMLTINGLIGITAQPHILTMNATGNTERSGRIGQTYGSFVKRFCTIGWALTGLIVAALVVCHEAPLSDAEHAFGYACLHLLGPGLVGLMVACVLAANMSTCSNFLVNGAALFTQNIYKTYFRAAATDRELLLVGRMSGILLMCLGVGFALVVEQILQAFLFLETLPTFLGIAIMGGFLWKRANRYGAVTAAGLSLVVYYACNYLMTCPWDGVADESLTANVTHLWEAWQHGEAGALLAGGQWKLVYTWLPGPYAAAMAVGLVTFIAVSLLTRPEDPERIDRFFDNQNRTTDDEGLPAGEPKPLAAERGQDLLMLDLPGWLTAARWRGFFHRYREDLIGFVLSWATVGLLILSAWAIMRIGR